MTETHDRRLVSAGLLANVFLATVKFLAGVLGHSYALIADAVESLIDILGSLVVFGGIQISRRDPDEDFPYGFGKAEALAAFVVGGLIVLVAVGIAVEAIREILPPHHAPAPFTLIVLVLVIALKETLHYFVRRGAESHGSVALAADAFHHRSDALTSLAAFIGISVALIGGRGWEQADDWAALAASGIILFNGILILRRASFHLLDVAPPKPVVQAIRDVAEGVPGVVAVEKLAVRQSGRKLFVDIHVHAHPDMPLREAHELSGIVKSKIRADIPHVTGVLVHMEPAEDLAGDAARIRDLRRDRASRG